ncbi:MAG: hypothetical protein JO121_23825 [Deltaproteobacteria bacterium]|nr:hypothetical protein [Deltaproteobacteria bacterium]
MASAADLSKLLFLNSIVQLGPGTGGGLSNPGANATAKSPAAPSLITLGTQVSAVIRYGVDVSHDAFVTGVNGIGIRYRDGNGFVVAQLICVDMDTGVESVLIGFDSRVDGTHSDTFQEKFAVLPGGAPLSPIAQRPAFYIVLTLSVLQPISGLVAFPPAVAALEVGVEGLNE